MRGAVVSAEVWLAPRFLESRNEITEKELRKVACSYLSKEKEDLDPLLDILANAGIVESAHPDEDDSRIAVYLKTSSGAVIVLLLGTEFPNAPSLGKYNGITPVAAREGFYDDLRIWAVRRKSTKRKASCDK